MIDNGKILKKRIKIEYMCRGFCPDCDSAITIGHGVRKSELDSLGLRPEEILNDHGMDRRPDRGDIGYCTTCDYGSVTICTVPGKIEVYRLTRDQYKSLGGTPPDER